MVAVCHEILLKGLNMFCGEIFAYPLYLQKQLASQNVQFFCSDVVCKYWPYLQRVVGQCPELQDLLKMHPFLSIMHAKAHSWMCELQMGGPNQEGAGTTMGEEVEEVNSFLSSSHMFQVHVKSCPHRHPYYPGQWLEQADGRKS
ncbi:hypothetical protein CHARACLAT_023239 [Characodon lateralis]|uniref:Uncharacterized protein n=1 Tax=Characodon lateralis TaxID=208331 RepID=A0ABU7DTH8_9TELE|nr:hypothetical protein [Characodon lateralis]